MHTVKRMFALVMVGVAILGCMTLQASAATSSSGTKTQTITVVTKANWSYPGSESITLAQSKGTFSYAETGKWGRETGKTKTKKDYGSWDIKVSATDGSHSFNKRLNGSSIKLNLKPNKTYKITVSENWISSTFFGMKYRNARWTSYPRWNVKSTWKVSSCY